MEVMGKIDCGASTKGNNRDTFLSFEMLCGDMFIDIIF